MRRGDRVRDFAGDRLAAGCDYTRTMACWRVTIGLVLALAGCGDGLGSPGNDGGDGDAVGTTGTAGTVGSPTSTVGEDEGGSPEGSQLDEGNDTNGGSSGSVEETLFGMSDDMPLVANIPSIKRGDVALRAWVVIEQVRPTTGRATLGRDHWIYVQDPYAEEHMGLRVLLQSSDLDLPEGYAVDLEGWILYDAQGWLLELDSMVVGAEEPPVEPVELRVAELRSDDALVYDDALVEVFESSPLVVTRRGPVTGTVLVAAVSNTRAAVLVDLRPFDVELDLPPGTRLSVLRGVAELGDGGRPVLLPRDGDDIIIER
jgi:hypothetical protein